MSSSKSTLAVTQRERRQSIDIGPRMGQVSPVMYWYKNGHFKNDDQARGAFELAYQQAMDGMGRSIPEWMGLNDAEFDAWMRNGELPGK